MSAHGKSHLEAIWHLQRNCQKSRTLFKEEQIYRMDHLLGYEICQNILAVRFSNAFLEPTMNHNHVASVRVSLKEDLGIAGRGYFTKYGIIRVGSNPLVTSTMPCGNGKAFDSSIKCRRFSG